MIHLHSSKVFVDDLTKAGCELPSPTSGEAWHWYAHRITLMRKKCVIVMEEASRYALVLTGLKKNDFSRFDHILLGRILAEAGWLCDLPPESNQRLIALLEQKGAPVVGSQGLDRSIQAHIRQVAEELDYLVKYRFERLPETLEEEIALGSPINDTPRKRRGDKDYFFPQRKWRESLLALVGPQQGTNVVNLAEYREGR